MDAKQIDRATQIFRAGTVPSLCPASSVGQRPGGDIPVASLWWLTGLHQLQCSYNTDNGCKCHMELNVQFPPDSSGSQLQLQLNISNI